MKKYNFDTYILLLEKIKKKCNTGNRKILLMNVINNFKYFSSFPHKMPCDVHHLNNLYVMNNGFHKIYFKFPLSLNETRNVYLGKDKQNYFVIKWLSHEKKSIKYEMSVLELLKKNNVKLCAFNTEYMFWDEPILCMEKLTKLDGSEDEIVIGRQILKILKKIHNFGVHSDIKPDNVMKKNNDFFLIDFGGFSMTKLKHGYHRKCWSNNWASQKRQHGQVTTYKNDLIELTYTLNAIYLSKTKKKYTHNDIKYISPHNKQLYEYFTIVNSIDDVYHGFDEMKSTYDKLIKILS
jgi:serine/threonine protein kinase